MKGEKESKVDRYSELADAFKNYSFVNNGNEGLLNPYDIKLPISNEWSKHNRINPWELWHGNLDAEIMFIGQDFSDENYFIENFTSNWEKECRSPTNKSLSELFSLLGYNIGLPGINIAGKLPLFFTNAVLGIKQIGGMAGAVRNQWYNRTAKEFTLKLIDIVNPSSIIVMGKHAYNMICKAYDLLPNDNFSDAINNNGTISVDEKRRLFVVAHCSGLGKRNRSFDKQKEDWMKIKTLL